MIKRYIEYTKEHKEKIRKVYKYFIKPQYLGEEGEMIAVKALNERQALEKIRKVEMTNAYKTRQEVEEEIKSEDISKGWVQLVDDNNKNHEAITAGEEYDDFVSLEEISDYPVFVYVL